MWGVDEGQGGHRSIFGVALGGAGMCGRPPDPDTQTFRPDALSCGELSRRRGRDRGGSR
jgi:hypothetical protein